METPREPTGTVRVGDPAPDFTLLDQSGTPVRLGELIGRRAIVLYFYPKDNTRGCTAEACAFRDRYTAFEAAGAQVVGVSSDSVASHRAFAAGHRLPFLLLSDHGGAVRRRYGVPATLGILPGRVTYVIDRAGVVRHIFSSQLATSRHVDEAVRMIRTINSAAVLLAFHWLLGLARLVMWPIILIVFQGELLRLGQTSHGQAAAVRCSDA